MLFDDLRNLSNSSIFLQQNVKKTFDEVLEEELENDGTYYDFSKFTCDLCNKNLDGQFNCYILFSTEKEDANPLFVCSPDCLKNIREKLIDKADKFDIHSINRCSAFYKCYKIGNLRNKCERFELLTKDKNLLANLSLSNFCNPGQAGIILAAIKINEFIEKFSDESSKQFKMMLYMTILVIILTLLTLVLTFIGVFDKTSSKNLAELQKMNTHLSEFNSNYNTYIKKLNTNQKNDLEFKDKILSDLKKRNKDIEVIKKEIQKTKKK